MRLGSGAASGLLLLLALLLMLLLLLLLALLIELLLLSTLLVVSCSCVQVVVVHFNFIILTHRIVRLWLVNVLMCCTLINLELRMHVLMLLMLLVSVCHCVQVVVVHCDVIMAALIMAHLQLDSALVCCKHAPHEPLLAFSTLYAVDPVFISARHVWKVSLCPVVTGDIL